MNSGKQPQDTKHGKPAAQQRSAAKGDAPTPEWADGLKKLYNSVVDEPLPDNFKDLLAKLDDSAESNDR